MQVVQLQLLRQRRLLHCRQRARGVNCNNDVALKQFALDGLGFALFPRFFVERELESGKLVQAIPDYPPPELSINAVYETHRHLLPKLQAFLGFLKERFGAAT